MTQNRTQFPGWFDTGNEGKTLACTHIHLFSQQLLQLFSKQQFNIWLEGLVDLWNKCDVAGIELVTVFHDWNVEQQQAAWDYFSNPKFADLVNAIFFYKIHPEQLFADVIHFEKLISVQMRLRVLHYYIESMQQHLYRAALQNGLIPGVDYFLHDEELPQGIMLEVNDEYKQMIQTAIKGLKLNANPMPAKRVAVDCLYDLSRAYKFWFNPSRLIDAVMVLQQNLLSDVQGQERNWMLLQDKMKALYSQLTTGECLDLYGYFANNDTRYLLYTFCHIFQGGTFDWLPPLNHEEKIAVVDVFDILRCVMEALRIELRNRQLLAEPYSYDLAKPNMEIDQRNRNAVFRVIKIYKRIHGTSGDVIEQLFQSMEQTD